MFKQNSRNQKGFTLIEVILVVVALSIIAAVVIVAINPTKQLGDTRNAQRQADVNTILNAVYQYTVDNNGTLPATITTSGTEICITTSGTCTGLIDLSVVTNSEKYLTAMPKDPSCPTVCDANGIGYTILKTANNRITVSAPDAEQSKTISATR